MKKTFKLMGLAVGLVLAVTAAARTYEYLEKSIDTEYGYPATVWRCVRLEVELGVEHPKGTLTFRGWKDTAAFLAGKPSMASRRVTIDNVEQLTNYAPLFQELLTKLTTTEGGVFNGAVYKTVEQADPPQVPEPK